MGEIRKVIGDNIKRLCSLKGIRQIDIAEHMGVSQGSVSNWIKGVNSIDIENLAELCRYLGVSLDQIFGIEPLPVEVTLSVQEADLIDNYRKLTPYAQQLLAAVATSFAGNPNLQKE